MVGDSPQVPVHLHPGHYVPISVAECRGGLSGGDRWWLTVGGKVKGQSRWGFLPYTLDVAALTLVWGTILVATNITIPQIRSNAEGGVLTLVIVLATVLIFQRSQLYVAKPSLPRTEEMSRVLTGIAGGLAAGVVFAAFTDWHIGAWEVLFGTIGSLLLVVIARGLLRYLGDLLPGHHEPARVVIVGTGAEAKELAEVILDHRETGLHLVGVVGHLPVADANGLESMWIGPSARLIELMHIHQATGAIVTPTSFRAEQFRQITSDLFTAGFDVHLSTGVSRLWEGRFDVRSLAHEPLVVMCSTSRPTWQLAIKRVVDVVGASVALVLAAPFMLLAALAIKLEDRGPVFFQQSRAGRGAQFFGMYKFRSMVTNAEDLKQDLTSDNERTGPLFKLSHDPRITRVGRIIRELSIDELPQLFNVLKGDMSLVGPRPALTEEEEAFDEELRDRFNVRPGITGLWQVEARSNASFAAYRRLDLHYVENWTLGLDIRILLATVEQVIVTAAMIPVKLLLRGRVAEQSLPATGPGVIDLRDRATAKLAAAAVAESETPKSEAPPKDGGDPTTVGAESSTT